MRNLSKRTIAALKAIMSGVVAKVKDAGAVAAATAKRVADNLVAAIKREVIYLYACISLYVTLEILAIKRCVASVKVRIKMFVRAIAPYVKVLVVTVVSFGVPVAIMAVGNNFFVQGERAVVGSFVYEIFTGIHGVYIFTMASLLSQGYFVERFCKGDRYQRAKAIGNVVITILCFGYGAVKYVPGLHLSEVDTALLGAQAAAYSGYAALKKIYETIKSGNINTTSLLNANPNTQNSNREGSGTV